MKVSLLVAAFAMLFPAFAAQGADDAPRAKGTVYHVVSFKFKEGTTPEQIKEVEEAFEALKLKVPQVKTLEWGTNVSAEQRNKGFTHCWVLTFADEKGRDAYLVAPAHKEFGKIVGPVLGDVFVIDFVAH